MPRLPLALLRWKITLRWLWFSMPIESTAKDKWPEFGIEFLVGLALALYQLGAEQMDVPHNFGVGLVCWIVVVGIAIRMFWIFPLLQNWPRIIKLIVTGMVVLGFIGLEYKPVSKAYIEKEYPLADENTPLLSPPQSPFAPSIDYAKPKSISLSSPQDPPQLAPTIEILPAYGNLKQRCTDLAKAIRAYAEYQERDRPVTDYDKALRWQNITDGGFRQWYAKPLRKLHDQLEKLNYSDQDLDDFSNTDTKIDTSDMKRVAGALERLANEIRPN